MKLNYQILLFLAGGHDYLNKTDEATFRSYSEIYTYFAERNKGAIRKTIEKLLRNGDIEKIVEDDISKFRITIRGRFKLFSEIPLTKFKEEGWDGLWRIVIFDIPEKEKKQRDGLREKLKELGFGKWQNSVYISPFNVKKEVSEFLKSQGLNEYVIFLETKEILMGDKVELCKKIFNLEKIHTYYLEFLETCRIINIELNKRGFNKKKIFNLWSRVREMYYQTLLINPGLPKEILPDNWLGEEAEKNFKKLSFLVGKIIKPKT